MTPGAALHGGDNFRRFLNANQIDHFPRASEMLNSGATEIVQHWPLTLRSDDALALINAVAGKRYKRLAGQVTDHLTAIGAAHDDKTDMRIGSHVRDQPLDTQILGVQGADDSQSGGRGVSDGCGQFIVIERAYRHGRLISQNTISARQWRPAMPFIDGISWTGSNGSEIERAARREIVQGDSRKADVAAEALISLRQQIFTRRSERGIDGGAGPVTAGPCSMVSSA